MTAGTVGAGGGATAKRPSTSTGVPRRATPFAEPPEHCPIGRRSAVCDSASRLDVGGFGPERGGASRRTVASGVMYGPSRVRNRRVRR